MTPKIPNRFFERLASFLSEADLAWAKEWFAGATRKSAFRVNTLKSSHKEVEAELTERGIRFEKFPGLPDAYILPKEDEFSLKGSKAFYEGKIYVQSLASQIPAHFMFEDGLHIAESLPNNNTSKGEGLRILDVCAAPGSKTTHIAALSGNAPKIIALEQSPVRAEKLQHNIRLQGVSNVSVIRIPAENYLSTNSVGMFDKILLDAPCSSEGRIRFEEEKTYSFWDESIISKRAAIGWNLLSLAWSRLKPGGTLIYSTCTLAPEENEAIISRALSGLPWAEIMEITLDLPFVRPGIVAFGNQKYDARVARAKRILPCNETEGFFIAKLHKK